MGAVSYGKLFVDQIGGSGSYLAEETPRDKEEGQSQLPCFT